MKKTAFRPTVDGRLEERLVLSTLTPAANIHPSAVPATFGGGNIDHSIAFVHAPAGVQQHAINLTSRTYRQILDRFDHLFASFNRTGDATRLDAGLAALSHRIPYGAMNLLPTWQSSVASAGVGGSVRDAGGALRATVKQDMITYFQDNIGTKFNIVKSHSSYATDRDLTFNGKV